MEYKSLGRTGLKVSEICLGTMQFGWTADEATSLGILNAAFEAGVTFFDTADVYSRWVEGNPGGVSETILGKWMKETKIRRDQLVIATKVRGKIDTGPNDEGLSRKHIFSAIDGSLRRLGIDYIDLYQAHSFDPNTPMDETLHAFEDLVRAGKVRYIGCSNYPAWRLTEALWVSQFNHFARYDSLQPHYNVVRRSEFERELMDVCRTYNLGVIPYSPLAGGFLTEKYNRDLTEPTSARSNSVKRRYYNERSWGIHDVVGNIASANGKTMSQVSLAWLLSNPIITSPIIGPRNIEQLDDNLGAVGFRLPDEDKKKLDEASSWQD